MQRWAVSEKEFRSFSSGVAASTWGRELESNIMDIPRLCCVSLITIDNVILGFARDMNFYLRKKLLRRRLVARRASESEVL